MSFLPAARPNNPQTFLVAVGVVLLALCSNLWALTGNELLMSSIKPSEMNKGVIDCMSLYDAVVLAVKKDQEKSPEIVAAALPKTRSLTCQKSLIMAAIRALQGDQRTLVPKIVVSAIRASGNCGGNGKDLEDGKSKDSPMTNCQCAAAFTSAALKALGPNAPENLVSEIVRSACEAAGGNCSNQIASAATNAAPQYADSIADVAARAAKNDFVSTESNVVFGVTERPIPAPFVTMPSFSGGIAPGEVTPVN